MNLLNKGDYIFRSDFLMKIADEIESRLEEFAEKECKDQVGYTYTILILYQHYTYVCWRPS